MFCRVLTHVTSPMWQPAHAAFDSAVAGCRQASPAENHHERPSRFNQLGNGRRGVQQCRSVLQAVAVETNVPRDYPATDRIQHAFLRHHRPCCWWRALGLCDGVVHMQSRHIQGVCLPACTCVFETSLEEEIHYSKTQSTPLHAAATNRYPRSTRNFVRFSRLRALAQCSKPHNSFTCPYFPTTAPAQIPINFPILQR